MGTFHIVHNLEGLDFFCEFMFPRTRHDPAGFRRFTTRFRSYVINYLKQGSENNIQLYVVAVSHSDSCKTELSNAFQSSQYF